MQITIHRGIDQIGGCITEISTATTRVLIDLGKNLPDSTGSSEDKLGNQDAIDKLTKGIDAIFYTHHHGDHIGHFHFVADSIPQYIGETAKKLIHCKHKRLSYIPGREALSKIELDKIERMRYYLPQQEVLVGDIQLTAYLVSHSAYDCYMFLIEADGKRILHTGDFRGHGYLSESLFSTLESEILAKGKIDFLITEGTMISRADEVIRHEKELQEEAKELMKEYKNIFVLCSSTDLERLASFNAANKQMKNRPLVCDAYQKRLLDIFSNTAGINTPLFNFEEVCEFNENDQELIETMQKNGFCFLMRPASKFENYYEFLKPFIDDKQSLLIYSMWEDYLDSDSIHFNENYFNFTTKFPNLTILHTSGHASIEVLAEVCNLVNTTSGIIPIHCEKSSDYKTLDIRDELKEKVILDSVCRDDVKIEIVRNR